MTVAILLVVTRLTRIRLKTIRVSCMTIPQMHAFLENRSGRLV